MGSDRVQTREKIYESALLTQSEILRVVARCAPPSLRQRSNRLLAQLSSLSFSIVYILCRHTFLRGQRGEIPCDSPKREVERLVTLKQRWDPQNRFGYRRKITVPCPSSQKTGKHASIAAPTPHWPDDVPKREGSWVTSTRRRSGLNGSEVTVARIFVWGPPLEPQTTLTSVPALISSRSM